MFFYVDDDILHIIVNQPSTADYLVCTKLASSNEKLNPVIGFGIYYDPTSIITLLANGQVVSSLIASFASLPYTEDLLPEDIENFNSPLKKVCRLEYCVNNKLLFYVFRC